MLFLALTFQFSFAQVKTVTGKITGEDGSALPGASVKIKGTNQGVTTGFDGVYTIKASTGDVLQASFIEMNTVEKTVADGPVNFVLRGNQAIQTIIIEGYGKRLTKAKSSTATSTISAEVTQNRPNVTFLQSLQGQAPGLQVTSSSGSPGSARINLLIRGSGSITSDSEPLIVLDGSPVNSAVFRNINPEDIESTSILRDAIATSIYGNRGSNGVLVINTKRGKYGSKFAVDYSSTVGFTNLPNNKYNIANSQQALRLERTFGYGAGNGTNRYFNTFYNINPTAPLSDSQINSYSTNDWTKDYFQTGVTKNHNLGITSSSSNTTSYTSLSYTEQEGIARNTDFKRATFRSNVNGKSANDRFNYTTSFTGAFSRRNQFDQETNGGINNNSIQNPLLGSLTALPYFTTEQFKRTGSGLSLYNSILQDYDYGNNNLVLQDVVQQGNLPNRFDELKFLLNLEGSYKLTNKLTYVARAGIDFNQGSRTFARAPWSFLAQVVRINTQPPAGEPELPFGGFEQRQQDREFGANIYNNISYSTKIGNKHSIDAGLSVEWVKAHRIFSQQQQNGLDPKFYVFDQGTGYANVGAVYPTLRPTVFGFKADAGLLSYFGNLNYDYDEKYGIDIVLRRDGSYKFAEENRWATFWAIGGRWNIDKEEFMQGSIFKALKIRGSYGTQGNQNLVDAADGFNPLLLGGTLLTDNAGAVTGYGNTAGTSLIQIGNPDLVWERQSMANIGLDFEIKNRLSGSIDIYERTTNDLYASNPISAVIGFGTQLTYNNGKLKNRGIEGTLKYKIFKKPDGFNLDIFGNVAYNKSEIIEVDRRVTGSFVYEVGAQAFEYFLQPYLGVNQSNGNPQFAGVDGTPQDLFNENARVRTGKSYNPLYIGGFGLNADFKGLFFDAQFSFAQDLWRTDGAFIWLYNPSYIGDFNVSADLLNAWTPTNTNTDIPSLTATNNDATIFAANDRFLYDASFVRLKNVVFGYSLSKNQLKSVPSIKSFKFFMQGENLLTWTKWRGFDPETSNVSNLGQYPLGKIFTFGINVGF